MREGLLWWINTRALVFVLLVAFVLLLASLLDLRQRVHRLERVSMFDPMTGLLGSDFFRGQVWPAKVRSGLPLTVLWIDLDNLKPVNDRYGHAAGDKLIMRAAETLTRLVRGGVDQIVRLHTAGDEFLVVASLPTHAAAVRWACNLHARLASAGVACSVGMAWTDSERHRDRAQLVEAAEACCRAAKQGGRGRLVYQPQAETESAANDQAIPTAITDLADTRKHGMTRLCAISAAHNGA